MNRQSTGGTKSPFQHSTSNLKTVRVMRDDDDNELAEFKQLSEKEIRQSLTEIDERLVNLLKCTSDLQPKTSAAPVVAQMRRSMDLNSKNKV